MKKRIFIRDLNHKWYSTTNNGFTVDMNKAHDFKTEKFAKTAMESIIKENEPLMIDVVYTSD